MPNILKRFTEDASETDESRNMPDDVDGNDYESTKGVDDKDVEDEAGEWEPLDKETEDEQEIDSLKDFIDVLKMHYDATENAVMKKKLAHHIIKLEIMVRVADVSADEILVRETPDGVLGYYDSDSNEIAMSRDVLDDFETDQDLYNEILVHETIHKEGIADEGLTQKLVAKRVPITPGIYGEEQKDVQKAFYRVGVDKAAELYEVEKPETLVDCYLEVELEKLWKDKLEGEFKKKVKKANARKVLEKMSKEESEGLEKEFEDGVPRLYEKLKSHGYNFEDKSIEILEELSSRST